jgi:hypothetical protein
MLVIDQTRTTEETFPQRLGIGMRLGPTYPTEAKEHQRNDLLRLFYTTSPGPTKEPDPSLNGQQALSLNTTCLTDVEANQRYDRLPVLHTANTQPSGAPTMSPGNAQFCPAITASPLQIVEDQFQSCANESQSWIERQEWPMMRRHCRSEDMWCPGARNIDLFGTYSPEEPISRLVWRV